MWTDDLEYGLWYTHFNADFRQNSLTTRFKMPQQVARSSANWQKVTNTVVMRLWHNW